MAQLDPQLTAAAGQPNQPAVAEEVVQPQIDSHGPAALAYVFRAGQLRPVSNKFPSVHNQHHQEETFPCAHFGFWAFS